MLTPDQIAEYLKNNPDFFVDQHALLAAMGIAEWIPGDAFYQRQMQVMQERAARQQDRIDAMLTNAAANQQLEQSLHRLSIDLLATPTPPPEKTARAVAAVRQYFTIRQVRLVRAAEPAAELDYNALQQRVIHLNSVCDDRVAPTLMAALFPASAGAVASCAFIPLAFERQIQGVMVLGDADVQRFTPGIGVAILDRLGQIIGAYLQPERAGMAA